MSSIPVLGIPVLNRGDLLRRCIASIDQSVEQLLLVNNGADRTVKETIQWASAEAAARKLPIREVGVATPGSNMGVAGSWNLISRAPVPFDAPYRIIVGNDIQFQPGDLAKMHAFTMDHLDHGVLFGNHGYSFFALTRMALTAGSFDENLYPAYLEDCDHSYRLQMAGIPCANVPDIKAVHGEAPHWGSSTIYSDPVLRDQNGITHGNNFEYYRKKWGGNNGEEKYRTPFNNPHWPVSHWEFDPVFRTRQAIWTPSK